MQLMRIVLHGCRHHQRPGGTPPEEQETAALYLYLLCTIVSAVMSIFGKLCSAAGLSSFFLVAVRSAALCLVVAPALIWHRINPFKLDAMFGLLVLRGILGFSSLSLWYLSMGLLPLSDANALSFISPIMVALMAPHVLGEVTPRAVYVSMPACLAGMLMVAQPSWLFGAAAGPTSQLGVVAGILQALFSAGSKLTIRALNTHHEPLECILFSMGFVSTVGAVLGALLLPAQQMVWPQEGSTWLFLGMTTLLAFIVQLTFTSSLRKCNASAAASLDYLSLLWTLLADALVFHKLPSTLSLCGGAIICGASLLAVLWGSRGAAGQPAPDGSAATVPPKPLQHKKEHYLGEAVQSHGSQHMGFGDSEVSDEIEAVSLLKAGAAAATAQGQQAAPVPAAAQGKGGSTTSPVHPKLTIAGLHTDSSKSWQLGTEVEGLPAPSCLKGGLGDEGGEQSSASTSASASAGKGGVVVELQAVAAAPAAMRTSTEKEQALQAAGK